MAENADSVPADLLERVKARFARRWVCQVLRSGFHNGCECSPREPHDGWRCGFRWEASLSDANFALAFREEQNDGSSPTT